MEGNSISRERLIQAGIQELEQNGPASFSLRRVAQVCGVSCAAPYRHFKDKQALLLAIAKEYNALWSERQKKAVETCGSDSPDIMLKAVCREYFHFLLDNPNYCMLATQTDTATSKWHLQHLLGESSPTRSLINTYCEKFGMSADIADTKICLLRGLLFGLAMMVGTGELQLTPEKIEAVYREMDSVFWS